MNHSHRHPNSKQKRTVDTEKNGLKRNIENTEIELNTETEKALTTESPDNLISQITILEGNIAQINQEVGKITQIIQANNEQKKKHQQIGVELERQTNETTKWEKLSKLIGSLDGKKFSRFAQGLTLTRLVELANRHLDRLNDRLYIRFLKHQQVISNCKL